MTSKYSTKRALISGTLAILMCVAMLIGTTFAWFTDTASTAVNKIRAGNLDIEVEYTLDGEEWAKLDEAADLFGDGLFEPGYTRVVAFRISNKGNLALKYNMSMNLVSETKGVNKAGKEFALSDYLKVKTSPIQQVNQIGNIMVGIAFDRNASKAIGWNPETDFKDTKVMTNDHILSAGLQVYFIMQVYMPESVGNEANAISTEKTPSIDFGINFVATQATVESDSIGPDYDKFADYPEVQPVATLEQLQEVLTSGDINGKTIKLYDNLDNVTNLRISNKDIALDLNGKSMKTEHLQVNGSKIVIKDTSEDRNGKIETTDSYAVVQAENSDVTIESGKFISRYNKDGGYGYAPVISVRNSELTINGGYFENTNDVGSYNYLIKAPSYNKTEKTTITINGGEFVSHRNYGYIVTGDSDANVEVVINGGTFTTEGNNSYLTNVKGNVVVNDCTFTAGNSVVFNIPKGYTATVKGGTFSVNNKSGFFSHNKTTGWVSDFTGTLSVDPIKPVKINQETYSGFFANGATQSAKGADGFYTISK